MKNNKNYIYSIDIVKMNILSLAWAVIVFLPLIILKNDLIKIFAKPQVLVLLIFWFILHEVIHGISYRLSKGVTNKDITFGAELEKGILFCLCKKKITKKDILRSLLAPLFIIGFVTLIIGFIFDYDWLIFLSAINIVGAIGDILMTSFIIRMPKDLQYIEIDNGTKFVLITNKDISKMKSLGIKLDTIETDFEKIAPKDFKKATISKTSYLIIAIIFIILILSLI